MGGTSFDICMVRDGEIPTTSDGWVQDERVAIKMVDIQSGGTGGGSIAWIDGLGLLRVGPRSAGGDPGPACYGKGGVEPTVTDADLVLGYVPEDFFLGGEIPLDRGRRRDGHRSGSPTRSGMAVTAAAAAVFVRPSTRSWPTRSPRSPRAAATTCATSTLVAGGGAGPVHAASIADLLHIPRVVIPPVAATYSAFGMFAMDVGRNYARSYITRATALDVDRVNALYAEMEARGRRRLRARWASSRDDVDLHPHRRPALHRPVPRGRGRGPRRDARRRRPSTAAIDNFHRKHEQLYTFNMPWQGVEFLTFRLRATTPTRPVRAAAHRARRRRSEPGHQAPADVLVRRRRGRHAGLRRRAAAGRRPACRPGHHRGDRRPPSSSRPATTARSTPRRNYLLTRRAGAADQSRGMRLEALAGGRYVTTAYDRSGHRPDHPVDRLARLPERRARDAPRHRPDGPELPDRPAARHGRRHLGRPGPDHRRARGPDLDVPVAGLHGPVHPEAVRRGQPPRRAT